MQIVLPIEDLQPGMFVDSVHRHKSDAGVKIKSRGMVRDKAIIQKLIEKGVLELKIDFTQSDIPVPEKYQQPEPDKEPQPGAETTAKKGTDGSLSTAKSRIKNKAKSTSKEQSLQQEFAVAMQKFEKNNRQIQSLYGDVTSGMKVDISLLNEVSKDIVASVLRNSNAMAILTRIKDKDAYNWRHMTNCAILITVFAKHLGLQQHIIEQLAMGAMLHDIGHAKLPQGLINKPGRFTELEYKAVKKHVAQSLGMSKGEAGITPIMLDMIINHHERLDGTGYPRKIKGDALSTAARMMAIVDVYDAITADQHHKEADEPINALRYLLSNKTQFDPILVQRFIKCMGVHPVGTIVKLTNERLGLVLEGNKGAPTAPMVRVFYNTKHLHHVTAKDLDLSHSDVKVIASVRPLDYQINLSRLLKEQLLV
ncbi:MULTISPECIES: HD-GYP domain-containing protein [unclassified Pseudoalteromonas]|uniref:HD-GYP domain-containing protein n=1 Tax=unclassified Pseudoalteromonas TaxID=194690 RepID=UPI0030155C21